MNSSTQLTQMTQQRHILAQMGIDCWISADCQTQEILTADIFNKSLPNLTLEIKTTDSSLSNLQDSKEELRLSITSKSPVFVIDTAKEISIEAPFTKESDNVLTDTDIIQEIEQSAFVVPFTLQGVKYGNWVLLVDQVNLSESEDKLWQEICLALSLNIEYLKFPIYESMNSVEFANATLAGFVFKLVKREETKIGVLTVLAEGVDDQRMLRLPLLKEMIAEPMLKQEFWKSINS